MTPKPEAGEVEGDYSDTTQAVLDLALEQLAGTFPGETIAKLQELVAQHQLADPEAVLLAVTSAKEATDGEDPVPEDSGGSWDS